MNEREGSNHQPNLFLDNPLVRSVVGATAGASIGGFSILVARRMYDLYRCQEILKPSYTLDMIMSNEKLFDCYVNRIIVENPRLIVAAYFLSGALIGALVRFSCGRTPDTSPPTSKV